MYKNLKTLKLRHSPKNSLKTLKTRFFGAIFHPCMWNYSGTGREDVLNEVIVPVVSNSTCRQRAWYGRRIKTDMVCAGYEQGGRDSCTGDSGGPLLRQPGFKKPWQVVGITSWGILCGLRRKPGVYTRVYPYLDWINQRIKGASSFQWRSQTRCARCIRTRCQENT